MASEGDPSKSFRSNKVNLRSREKKYKKKKRVTSTQFKANNHYQEGSPNVPRQGIRPVEIAISIDVGPKKGTSHQQGTHPAPLVQKRDPTRIAQRDIMMKQQGGKKKGGERNQYIRPKVLLGHNQSIGNKI